MSEEFIEVEQRRSLRGEVSITLNFAGDGRERTVKSGSNLPKKKSYQKRISIWARSVVVKWVCDIVRVSIWFLLVEKQAYDTKFP